jgi:hypothetical protein
MKRISKEKVKNILDKIYDVEIYDDNQIENISSDIYKIFNQNYVYIISKVSFKKSDLFDYDKSLQVSKKIDYRLEEVADFEELTVLDKKLEQHSFSVYELIHKSLFNKHTFHKLEEVMKNTFDIDLYIEDDNTFSHLYFMRKYKNIFHISKEKFEKHLSTLGVSHF